MEIGYAHGLGIPVYSVERPVDVTMASLVTQAESPDEAIALIRDGDAPAPALGLGSLQLYYERASLARGWEDETAEDCMRLLAGGLFAYGLSGECDANANSSFCRQLAHLKRTAKAEGGESLACKLDALGGLLTDGALYYAEPEGLILKIFAGGSNTLLGVQLYRDC
jgi:hypothetical protein